MNDNVSGRGIGFKIVFMLGAAINLLIRFIDDLLLEGEAFLQLVISSGAMMLLIFLFPCTILFWLWQRRNPASALYQQAISGFKWCLFLLTFCFMPSLLEIPRNMRVHYHIGACEALIPKLEEFHRREGRYPESRRELVEKVTAAFHLPVCLSSGSYSLLIPLPRKSQHLSLDGPPPFWEFTDFSNSDHPSMRIPVGGMKGFPNFVASHYSSETGNINKYQFSDYEQE